MISYAYKQGPLETDWKETSWDILPRLNQMIQNEFLNNRSDMQIMLSTIFSVEHSVGVFLQCFFFSSKEFIFSCFLFSFVYAVALDNLRIADPDAKKPDDW